MAISRISQSTVQAGFPKFNNTWDGLSAVGAMEPISAITLSASSASIEFNNIPGTYTHLQVRGVVRSSRSEANSNIYFGFNNDVNTNNYYGHYLGGDGSSASGGGKIGTSTNSLVFAIAATSTASSFTSFIVDILDYSSTLKNKTSRAIQGYDTNGDGRIFFTSGLWMNSANAITSIQITDALGSCVQYSSFTLYGIK